MVLEKERVFLFFGLFCLLIFLLEKVQCILCLCIYGMIPGVGRATYEQREADLAGAPLERGRGGPLQTRIQTVPLW